MGCLVPSVVQTRRFHRSTRPTADGLLDGRAGAASAAAPGGAATDGREGLPAGRSVGEPGEEHQGGLRKT